jgi:predicted carbohydrate-binding protein with CBM5 and CBM33 domain
MPWPDWLDRVESETSRPMTCSRCIRPWSEDHACGRKLVRKRLEGLAVAIVLLSLVFLVYRDVSAHKIIEFGAAGVGEDSPAARAAVEQLCAQNGGCTSISYLASVAETESTYGQVAYILALPDGPQVIVVASMESGRVVRVR